MRNVRNVKEARRKTKEITKQADHGPFYKDQDRLRPDRVGPLDLSIDTLYSVIKEFIEIPELNASNVNYSNIALLFNKMADRVIRPICAEFSMVNRKHQRKSWDDTDEQICHR
ncbi:1554_t:CDS:2 [Funneliformis mosseae]|uniref:1554_t:CDS:1 n=1 Tax=Funneliformis mosseae TaxID=27381 RepID=A0A9N9HL09_FUNMO|nr:1554_t:CDS:2 [Funneliformis mosseae]